MDRLNISVGTDYIFQFDKEIKVSMHYIKLLNNGLSTSKI